MSQKSFDMSTESLQNVCGAKRKHLEEPLAINYINWPQVSGMFEYKKNIVEKIRS